MATVRSCQDFVRTVFGPPILVLATSDADATCMKNNLTFLELLKPFSQTQAPSMKSESFHLRFLGLADLVRPSVRAAQQLTSQYVGDTALDLDAIAADTSPLGPGAILVKGEGIGLLKKSSAECRISYSRGERKDEHEIIYDEENIEEREDRGGGGRKVGIY